MRSGAVAWFRPMGLNLRVEAQNAELLRICTDMFGGFGPGDRKKPADLRVSAEAAVTADPVFQLPDYQLPAFHFYDGWAYVEAGNKQIIRAHPATGTVDACFPQELLRDEAVLRRHYLQFALAVLLEARGFTGVHAAGLERNGCTLLVRGARGSGKSVLACEAVGRGWRLLADSTLWIGPEGNWWGIPWWLHLRPSALSLFPNLFFAPTANTGGGSESKLEISIIQIRSNGSITHAPAGTVLFLDQNFQSQSRLETITAEESLALWAAGATGREGMGPNYGKRVAQALAKGGYRLRIGSNLGQGVDLLDRLAECNSRLIQSVE